MQKQNEILEIIASLENNNQRPTINNISKILEEKNIKISRAYVRKIFHNKKNVDKKLKFNAKRRAKRRIKMAELTRLGWTMQMIADKYNITRQAVSLLLKKASEKDNQIVVKGKLNRKGKDNSGPNCVLVKRKKSLQQSKICTICNKSFIGKKKYCSQDCQHKAARTGGKWSRYQHVALTCNYCGKTFQRSNYLHSITMIKNKSNKHYCSQECYHKSTVNV